MISAARNEQMKKTKHCEPYDTMMMKIMRDIEEFEIRSTEWRDMLRKRYMNLYQGN